MRISWCGPHPRTDPANCVNAEQRRARRKRRMSVRASDACGGILLKCTADRQNRYGSIRVRDSRPKGRDTGAPAQGAAERVEPMARRGLGAVGNGRFVAYGARSPARSAAEGHARPPPSVVFENFARQHGMRSRRRGTRSTRLGLRRQARVNPPRHRYRERTGALANARTVQPALPPRRAARTPSFPTSACPCNLARISTRPSGPVLPSP